MPDEESRRKEYNQFMRDLKEIGKALR